MPPEIAELFKYHWYIYPLPVLVLSCTLPGAQNCGGEDGQIMDDGNETTVTTVAGEVEEHPPDVSTTVYEPAVVAVYVAEVAPEIFALFLFH